VGVNPHTNEVLRFAPLPNFGVGVLRKLNKISTSSGVGVNYVKMY